MSHASRDLTHGCKPFCTLNLRRGFRLIGVADDHHIQVDQLGQGQGGGLKLGRIAGPRRRQVAEQAVTEPGERSIGVDLIEADIDVTFPDPPASPHVFLVVPAGEEIDDPVVQRLLEPLGLCGPPGDVLADVRVTMDFFVEIVDQARQVGRKERPDTSDALFIVSSPVDIRLQELVSAEQSMLAHA